MPCPAGIVSSLGKFTGNTRFEGVVEGKLSEHLKRLEMGSTRNVWSSTKAVAAPHPGCKNPICQHGCKAAWQKQTCRSQWTKMECESVMCQPATSQVVITNRIVSRGREVILPFSLAHGKSHLESCIQFWACSRKALTYCSESSRGAAGWPGAEAPDVEGEVERAGLVWH